MAGDVEESFGLEFGEVRTLGRVGEFQGELAFGRVEAVVLVAFGGEGVESAGQAPVGDGKPGKFRGGHLRRGEGQKASGGVLGHRIGRIRIGASGASGICVDMT